MTQQKVTSLDRSDRDTSPHAKQDCRCVISSNHVMVNRIRYMCGLNPLKRSGFLDEMARQYAKDMASETVIFPTTMSNDELQSILKAEGSVGQNVYCFSNINSLQEFIDGHHSENDKNDENILSDEFTEFGMGTAFGRDGKLYMCQFFRQI